jgi:hypothetical protein
MGEKYKLKVGGSYASIQVNEESFIHLWYTGLINPETISFWQERRGQGDRFKVPLYFPKDSEKIQIEDASLKVKRVNPQEITLEEID